VVDAGYDLDRTLSARDLVNGNDVFVAVTGVTSGALLAGVHYTNEGATTDSLVMRSQSGTMRRIMAEHSFDKLAAFTGMRYRS
jgi:fructose-1,6-bisphosphatase II